MESELNKWFYLWTALTLHFYMHLDNCDGKQARKTNSSSPLGMIFDHGCDIVTLGL